MKRDDPGTVLVVSSVVRASTCSKEGLIVKQASPKCHMLV